MKPQVIFASGVLVGILFDRTLRLLNYVITRSLRRKMNEIRKRMGKC